MDSLRIFLHTNLKKIFLIILIQTSLIAIFFDSNFIQQFRIKVVFEERFYRNETKTLCSNNSVKLEEDRVLRTNPISDNELKKALENQTIKIGGCWSPSDCIAKSRLAVIIPFRNREEHLNIFLLNMHPLFAKQQLSYCIYLIEPVANITFNRGILMNIGFVESNKDSNDTWQCHAYHDVDMLSENENTPYSCPENPTHLTVRADRWGRTLPYNGFFGGATLLKKEHYIKSNGFSNLFFGWGGEDDDHGYRVKMAGFQINRFSNSPNFGRYTSLQHKKDVPNPERFNVLNEGRRTYNNEGLNSLIYDVVKVVKTDFYTKVYVFYNKALLFERKKS